MGISVCTDIRNMVFVFRVLFEYELSGINFGIEKSGKLSILSI